MTARVKTLAATEDAVEATNDAVQETVTKAETLVADAQKSFSVSLEKFTKGIEGLTAFSQENVDALVKASEIAAKAAEGIGSEVSAYSKKAFEDGVAAAQDFAAAKTLTELVEKQTARAELLRGIRSAVDQDERDPDRRDQGHRRPARRPRHRGRREVQEPLALIRPAPRRRGHAAPRRTDRRRGARASRPPC